MMKPLLDRVKDIEAHLVNQGMTKGGVTFLKACAVSNTPNLPDDISEAIAVYDERSRVAAQNHLDSLLFRVWDTEKERYADYGEALVELVDEEWASHLMRHDMEGWLIDAEGGLVLTDECAGMACPPSGRFELRWQHSPDSSPSVPQKAP